MIATFKAEWPDDRVAGLLLRSGASADLDRRRRGAGDHDGLLRREPGAGLGRSRGDRTQLCN